MTGPSPVAHIARKVEMPQVVTNLNGEASGIVQSTDRRGLKQTYYLHAREQRVKGSDVPVLIKGKHNEIVLRHKES